MTETCPGGVEPVVLRCSCCNAVMSYLGALKGDAKVEHLPDDYFDFLIANLGLRGVSAKKEHFHVQHNHDPHDTLRF